MSSASSFTPRHLLAGVDGIPEELAARRPMTTSGTSGRSGGRSRGANFPVYDAEGNLTREFVVVSNADPKVSATVVDGNERVVRARLDDAKFFYEEDLKVPMDEFVERLGTVVFQEKLGTVRQKVTRMEVLSEAVAKAAGADERTCGLAKRAAHLAKADLVSQAVVEFTNQQGVMGGYYAKAAGEDQEVCDAIREHYRPRFAGDELPSGIVGKCVAIADKLDTVCGIFAIDEPPTGSSDPFAVRRAAIGMIAMLRTLPAVTCFRSSSLPLRPTPSRASSLTPRRLPLPWPPSSRVVLLPSPRTRASRPTPSRPWAP